MSADASGEGAGPENLLIDGKDVLTGNFFYDYFMGTSLNPRNGTFDWRSQPRTSTGVGTRGGARIGRLGLLGRHGHTQHLR